MKRKQDDEMIEEQPDQKKIRMFDEELENLFELIGNILLDEPEEQEHEDDEQEEEFKEEEYEGPLEHCIFCERDIASGDYTCIGCAKKHF